MTSKQAMLFRDFESLARQVAAVLRTALGNTDVSHMTFDLHIEGRTLSGDLELVYELSEYSYNGNTVKGNSIEPILEEFLRRRGWIERHQPLCLPAAASPDKGDEG